MIVLDDIAYSLQRAGGISNYWSRLHEALKQADHNMKVVRRADCNNVFSVDVAVEQRVMTPSNLLPLKADRYLPVVLPKYRGPAVFHSSYYRVPAGRHWRVVTTVHDFAYERFSHGLRRTVHSLQKRSAIQRADVVICISESTKADLTEMFPAAASKAVTIYHGIDPMFFEQDSVQLSTENPVTPNPYMLWIGNRNGYKNFGVLIEPWQRQSDFDLVLVGGEPLSRDELRELNRHPSRAWIQVRPDTTEKLVRIYRGAFLTAYLSKYEGFGMPITEAQAAGCPVIAWETPVAREVSGGNAFFIPSQDSTAEILDVIHRLSVSDTRQELVNNGKEWASKFTWERTMSSHISIYKELLG